MEKKLTRFTFYDMYWNVIKNAKNEEIGRFIKAVCAFVFDNVPMAPPKSAQEDYYQSCILSELEEVKRLETQGKVPKKYNQKMLHFAFLDVYYKAIKLMNDEDSGAYLKALCSYAFNGKQTSKLKPPVDGYFEFAKLKLELSKIRATSGKKGGKTERVKVTDEEIDSKKEDSPTLTFNTINRHISKMVYTKVVSNKSPWLQKAELGKTYVTPASHGEGRFVAPKEWIDKLFANGQVATQYADFDGNISMDEEWNVNGSYVAIEGITSPDGRCLGKMAHVERRGDAVAMNIYGEQDLKIFESGVEYFK